MIATQKPIKQASLVDRKVCFISDAGNWVGRVDICPKANSPATPLPQQAESEHFYRQREGATCRNSAVSSDSQPHMGHRWSDQRHLGCFRYSSASVPGLVFFRFSEASSGNCGSSCPGHSLPIM